MAENPATLLVRLLGYNSNYPIFDNLCCHLDIIDIIRLTRTCRELSDLYRRLLQTHWNINRRLQRFVNDPNSFRSRLGDLDGLISGGFALQYFDRSLWEESDLDIYVQGEDGDSNIQGFIDYLVRHEGYEMSPLWRYKGDLAYNGDDSFEGIQEIIDLKRKNQRKIQLLRCHHAPIKVILNGFYNTAVVNVITWNGAYCLFPHLTFTKRRLEMLQTFGARFRSLVEKYERRGWTLGEGPNTDNDCRIIRFDVGFSMHKLLADGSTWKIAFNTDNVPAPTLPARDLEHAHVVLEVIKEDQDVVAETGRSRHYSIATPKPFVSLGLRKEYFYAKDWSVWLARKLYPRIKEQLARLEEASRPPFYNELMFKGDETMSWHATEWKPPASTSWRFYDDMIQEWFEDYKVANHWRHQVYRSHVQERREKELVRNRVGAASFDIIALLRRHSSRVV